MRPVQMKDRAQWSLCGDSLSLAVLQAVDVATARVACCMLSGVDIPSHVGAMAPACGR